MPHQCVHCSKVYPDASKELLEGCICGSHFFFYVKQEQIEALKETNEEAVFIDLNVEQKKQIESDVREIMGVEKEDIPVILDLESIRVLGPGKFEIDIASLFNQKKPLIYKLEEGKYIIDLASSMNVDLKERDKFSKGFK